MSVKKQYLKSKPVCKVTFRLLKAKAPDARTVCLAGDFNGWQTAETPMKPLKNGDFVVTLLLKPGREYQYRYIVDGRQWLTDAGADKVVYCRYAQSDNSVVVV